MSGVFGSPQSPSSGGRGRRVVVPVLVVVAVVLIFGSVFVTNWTDWLWYKSVGFAGVFETSLLTRLGLFLAAGAIFGVFLGFNVWYAYRHRPDPLTLRRDDPAARYRYALTPIARPVFIALNVVAAGIAGVIGQAHWMEFLQWYNRTPFGVADPQFHRDISFFVFTLPWLRYVASYAFTLALVTIALTVLVNYVFGGISFGQRRGMRFTRGAQVQLSLLVAFAILVKAFGYWLGRFGFEVDMQGRFDGITYTDDHARIPANDILVAVSVICALLFVAAVFFRSWTLPVISFSLLLLTAALIGGVWPAVMQQFQVSPSEPDRERPYLSRNIAATRAAYDVNDVEVRDFTADTQISPQELAQSAETLVSSRIIDPTLVSPAFQQLQQVRGYYSVPDTLDVDRYVLPGNSTPQDVVIAARGLYLNGLQDSQRNWANDHTVYTHGYGVIAARGNERGPQGEPVWVTEGIPPVGDIKFTGEPQIYFGEGSPDYSIVGRVAGAAPVEVNTPQGGDSAASAGDSGGDSLNTYAGKGGVPMGSLFDQMLYAIRFAEPKIVLSDRVNANSKILYNREPRDRVQAVAPWLTIDGDSYPAVVNGRVVWIVDGYTTSANYPNSQHRSLREATSDTLTQTSAQAMLPSDQVNYMRNSVKAVVDAYDGTVTLYQWDTKDPILKTWMKAFPGSVKPKSDISPELMQHLRYPQDLYKVQRDVLSRYHVTDADTFYQDNERWKVPEEPSGSSTSLQPPYYLSMARPGQLNPEFSLTSVYLPNKRQNLAAFMSVNSEASSPDFGKLQILKLPSNTQVGGPNQVSGQFSADKGVTAALLPYVQAKATITTLYGNLLTLPLVDKANPDKGALMYVQPIYIQRTKDQGSYPLLQYVVASFGGQVGIGQTLDEALAVSLGLSSAPSPGGSSDTAAPATGSRLEQLQQATKYYQAAQQALTAGDLNGYQQNVNKMAGVLAQLEKQEAATPGS